MEKRAVRNFVERIALPFREPKTFLQFLLLFGPIFLFLSLSLANGQNFPNYDLWLVIPLGIFFLWKYPGRGLVLSLALLAIASLVKHIFLTAHLWQLGLEGSIAIGLFITAFSLKESSAFIVGFEGKISEQKKALEELDNKLLEQEQAYQKEKDELHGIILQTQGELKSLQQKNASLENLSEAARNLCSSNTGEKDALIHDLLQKNKELRVLKLNYDALQEEQLKLKDSAALRQTNLELLNKLNQARVEKYQTHLINQTLARLLSKEAKKVQEALGSCHVKEMEQNAIGQNLKNAEQEIKSLCLRLEKASHDLEAVRGDLNGKNEKVKSLQDALSNHEKLRIEGAKEQKTLVETLSRAELSIKDLQKRHEEELNTLKSLLQTKEERIKHLTSEIITLSTSHSTQHLAELGALKKEVGLLQEKLADKAMLLKKQEESMQEARRIESCYLQLRKQFEEKSETLHATRVELFNVETELLALQREKENRAFEDDEALAELTDSLGDLEEEKLKLEKEREELLTLVTQLSHFIPESAIKNRPVKKKSSPIENQLPLIN